ncbi:unnamed protein product [Auanema sp. JU1783]|nr:unnamed protein product [Auanema sp. JU1783]
MGKGSRWKERSKIAVSDDLETRHVVVEFLSTGVQEIQRKLLRPTDPGNMEPIISVPAINEGSSFRKILKRLSNLVKIACLLADMAKAGPLANNDKEEALEQVRSTLRDIVNNISPATSMYDSSTD